LIITCLWRSLYDS